jgi:hypothetical protein
MQEITCRKRPKFLEGSRQEQYRPEVKALDVYAEGRWVEPD